MIIIFKRNSFNRCIMKKVGFVCVWNSRGSEKIDLRQGQMDAIHTSLRSDDDEFLVIN